MLRVTSQQSTFAIVICLKPNVRVGVWVCAVRDKLSMVWSASQMTHEPNYFFNKQFQGKSTTNVQRVCQSGEPTSYWIHVILLETSNIIYTYIYIT